MIRRRRSDSPAAPEEPDAHDDPAREGNRATPTSFGPQASWIVQPGRGDLRCPLLPAHSVDQLHDAETRDMSAQTTVANGVDELSTALADDAGFESWYRRALPRVYSYLVSRSGGDVALAEDLTQQTFTAAIDQRSSYDGRADTVTWLCGIARHKLADHFRAIERDERRQRRMEVRQIQIGEDQGTELGLEDRSMIAEILRSLPASQRAVLVFVVLDDLPVAEAARLLGKSRGATESLLFRARDSFRRAYRAENRDD
jgi:RNA polymerase sigma-70 factor, ECF subfamily